jgi:RNA polymerase sigma-70 factor, ECF subfamily
MTADEYEARFQMWLRDHFGLVLRVVRSFAEAPHDQDDLFQDVLVNLWSSIPNYRGDAKVTTWIYRVAFNTAVVWQRGERRRQRRHAAFLNEAAASTQPSPDDGRYDAIRQLPKVDASLALMHLDGLSYQEMSEVLGISENYVGVKLTRIRQQLSGLMQGAFDEL